MPTLLASLGTTFFVGGLALAFLAIRAIARGSSIPTESPDPSGSNCDDDRDSVDFFEGS